MYILFNLLICIGQLLISIGCDAKSMTIMLLGRGVFGLGGECIGICLTGIIVKIFDKKETGLALGLSISIARIGSIINALVSPNLSFVN